MMFQKKRQAALTDSLNNDYYIIYNNDRGGPKWFEEWVIRAKVGVMGINV